MYDKSMYLNNVEMGARKPEGDGKMLGFTNNLQVAGCQPPDADTDADIDSANRPALVEPRSCPVCLEETTPLKNHGACPGFLCNDCIEKTGKYCGAENLGEGQIICPFCRATVSSATDFVDADDATIRRNSMRMLNVHVLFRQAKGEPDCDGKAEGDSEGSVEERELFGHPHLIKVPNRLPGALLYNLICKRVPPHSSNYSIVFVDGQGSRCSRCLVAAKCKGCLVPSDEEVSLHSKDNLAVSFTVSQLETLPVEHRSLRQLRHHDQLSLYDCLNAFCESETLDEHNPWYCPSCERNQCATKTLSVWRYPDYLIVYLKRFVFHEYTSVKLDNKVAFPLTDLKPPTTLNQGGQRLYDLYACVNHIGGASAGHYTAYARNPKSGAWHLFNDDTVTAQKPSDADFSNAYILFYQWQGIQPDNSALSSVLDQLLLGLETRSSGSDLSLTFEPRRCRSELSLD